MLTKDTQEQSLDSYFSGLMLGAGDALWDSDIPTQPRSQRPNQSERPQRDPKACLPSREAAYVDVVPLTVVGLKLALPKDAVAEIRPWPESVTRFDADAIYSTVVLPDTSPLRVIDTARVVVPKSHPRYEQLVTRRAYRFLLLLNGGAWALAVDQVDEEVILPANALCWRDRPGQDHPWLAATFRDFGYALVDAARLVELVKQPGTQPA